LGTKPSKALRGICGRISKGRTIDEFKTLTDDENDRNAFFLGSDGLEQIIGKSTLEILVNIGFEIPYIIEKINNGYKFQLLILPEGNQEIMFQANWEGVSKLVEFAFPEVKSSFDIHFEAMKSTNFEEIQRKADFDFFEARASGKTHPNYFTLERFMISQRSLVETRAFLYHTVGLRELFKGDGYTYTHDGKKGYKEYLVPNHYRHELEDLVVVELDNIPLNQLDFA